MKDMNSVFSEKNELQHRSSILIALLGIPSLWGSQDDIFQKKYFRSIIAFLDPGETRVVKKLIPKNWKKMFNFLHF